MTNLLPIGRLHFLHALSWNFFFCAALCLLSYQKVNGSPNPDTIQTHEITAFNADPDDDFGSVIASSGNTLVVGAPLEDGNNASTIANPNNNSTDSGALYIYVREGTEFRLQAYISPPSQEGFSGARFGQRAVAIDGDTLVVGEPTSLDRRGTADIYKRVGETWTLEDRVISRRFDSNSLFGYDVAVSGDTVAISAVLGDSTLTGRAISEIPNVGTVHIFQPELVAGEVEWQEVTVLVASNHGSRDDFGESIALSGDTLIVGAPGEGGDASSTVASPNNNLSDSGAVYIFNRSGDTWTQQAYLKGTAPAENQFFGHAVDLSGNTAVVGVPRASGGDGVVYVYERTDSNWAFQAEFTGSTTPRDFGRALDLRGNRLLVGSSGGTPEMYLFERSGVTWTETECIISTVNAFSPEFSRSVALMGQTMLASDIYHSNRLADGDGYVLAFNSELKITATFPTNRTLGVAVDTGIAFTFDANIVKGSGSLILYDLDDAVIEQIAVEDATINSGNLLVFNPVADLETGTTYKIELPAGIVGGVNGEGFLGSDAENNRFTTFTTTAYVDAAGDFSPSNPAINDIVTWKSGQLGEATGLTFGVNAFSSIQDAIDSIAIDGSGIIRIAEGLYNEGSTITVDKSVRIIGDGAGLTQLTGNADLDRNLETGEHRVINISGGSRVITIEDLSIINGQTNSSGFGGGLRVGGANDVTIRNAIFSNNFASRGAAISNTFLSNIKIENTTFVSNRSRQSGGAISNSLGDLSVKKSTFTENVSDNIGGGAIYMNGGDLTVVNSTLSGNLVFGASNNGGAVYSDASGRVRFENSTIIGNRAGVGSALSLPSNAVLEIANTVIARNTDTSSVAEIDVAQAIVVEGVNFIGDLTDSGLTASSAVLTYQGGQSLDDIIDPVLADNGGATLTHNLKSGSPLVDGGDNASAPAGATTDQRGSGFDRIFTEQIDIGAIEFLKPPRLTTSSPEDGSSDFSAGGQLVFVFDQDIVSGSDPITVRRASDDTIISGQVIFGTDQIVIILDESLEDGTDYYVNFGPQSISSVSNTIYFEQFSQINFRTAVSVTYVDAAGDFTPANPSVGQTVTWNGASGAVANLTFGTNAFVSVREAVDAVESNGTVYIATGDYAEGAQIDIAKSLTLQGDGKEATILSGANTHRVVDISGGLSAEVTINDLMVTSGFTDTNGAGIRNAAALTLNRVSVSDNVAETSGGGIDNSGEFPNPSDPIPATLAITDSTISGNQALAGAGINSGSNALTVTSSTISGNIGSGSTLSTGGGIRGGTGVMIINSTISGNSAYGGGGIDGGSGVFQIIQSTITGNTASAFSGGIYRIQGSSTLTNSIVAGNSAPSFSDISGVFTLVGVNFIGNTSGGGTGFRVGTDLSFASTSTTINELLDTSLEDNGGPTLTHALLVGSPAINGGANSEVPETLVTDQRGSDRIFDVEVDIGAVETVIPLGLISVTPENGQQGVNPDSPIEMVFTQDLVAGAGAVTLGLSDDDSIVPASVSVVGNTVTITPDSSLPEGTRFYIDIEPDALSSVNDQLFAGINDPTAQTFTTCFDKVYVALAGAFSPAGAADGDTVTWKAGSADEVTGLILGANAVVSPNAGVENACAGGNVYVDVGTFLITEIIVISKDLTIKGSGFGTIFDGGGTVKPFAINSGANVTLENLAVMNGFAAGDGGALSASVATATIRECLFSNNSASDDGGAIGNIQSTVTIIDSSFENNTALDSGGAFLNVDSNFTVINSTFTGNTAFELGGAMTHVGGQTMMLNCTFSGNSVTGTGQSANSLNGLGGAIHTNGANSPDYDTLVSIINCTIIGNSASVSGGGVHVSGSRDDVLFVSNSIIAGNTADFVGADVSNQITTNGVNFIGDTDDATISGSGSTLTFSSTGRTIGDVINTTLADNGGPTRTHALFQSSPLVNAGSDAAIPEGLTADQRGANRIVGASVDIGALELQSDVFIIRSGDSPIFIECGIDTFVDPGATARSLTDGDISGNIVVGGTVNESTLGSYTITYNVTDSNEVAAEEVTRTVIVRDTTAPVITLNGASSLELQGGPDAYEELGATVSDACDPSVELVIDASAVDTTAVGEYIVTYNATDASGNAATQVTRTVNVVAPPAPEFVSMDPETGSLGVDADSIVTLGFDQDIFAGEGTIFLRRSDTDDEIPTTIAVSGSEVTLTPDEDLPFGVRFYVEIEPDALINGFDLAFAGINDPATLTFTTCAPAVYVDGDLSGSTVGQTVDWTGTNETVSDLTFGWTAFTSIQEAIDSVCVGGTVFIAAGTYQEGRQLRISKSLTLQGDGAETTILDGERSYRHLEVAEGVIDFTIVETVLVINDLSFIDGAEADDSGEGDNLGGSIYAFSSTVTINDSIFRNNEVLGLGGAIYNQNGDLTINRSILTENQTDEGGSGGAIFNGFRATLTITDSILSRNFASDGGAIANASRSTAEVVNSTFSNNAAINQGGAISNDIDFAQRVSTLVLTNSTLHGNRVEGVGGAIFNAGSLSLLNSTITANSTDFGPGGGIRHEPVGGGQGVRPEPGSEPPSPTFSIVNSIVAGNVRGGDPSSNSDISVLSGEIFPPIDGPLDPIPGGGEFNIASSFIGDLSGSSLLPGGSINSFSSTSTTLGDLLVVDVSGDPVLADNGGPTPTVGLPAGSLAIDTGDNDAVPATLENDQRGAGFPRIAGSAVDLGAFEYPNTAPVITLEGDATIRIEAGIVATYTDLGATASDAEDGDLTSSIVTVGVDAVDTAILDEYTITYDVSDSAGQAAEQVTRTVIVEDTIAPVITLEGDASVQLRAGLDSYNELGASVFDAGDPTVTVSIGGDTVVTSALGEYIVTYNAIDVSGNRATEVTRVVNVVNTAPTITLEGDSTVRVELNIGSYSEPGATASDAEEGDTLTDNIVIGGQAVDPSMLGEYTITYNVSDSFGQAAEQVTRTVIVEDTIAPVIDLTGAASIQLRAGVDSYEELGATVSDAGDPSVEVVIDDSAVDTTSVGEYIVTYNATDASDNAATQVTRTVNVVPVPEFVSMDPAPGSLGVDAGSIITLSFDQAIFEDEGTIFLRRSDTDEVIPTAISVSGADVTLTPDENLPLGVRFYVEIEPDALVNAFDVAFAGINDSTALTFTTCAPAVYVDVDLIGSIDSQTVDWTGTNETVSDLTFGWTAFTSIQDAIDSVCVGGTVFIAAGTYQEGAELEIFKSLTLQGDGAEITILDGEENYRHMWVEDGSSGNTELVINDLSFIDGDPVDEDEGPTSGGSLFIFSAAVTINDCIFRNNGGSDRGGAIFNQNGDLAINRSLFTENQTNEEGTGGAIFNGFSGTLIITDSILSRSFAGDGGAIANAFRATAEVVNSTLSDNVATRGGAISNKTSNFEDVSTLIVTNSTLHGNRAEEIGGAIFNSSSLTVLNSTITANLTGFGPGGGIYNGFGGIPVDPGDGELNPFPGQQNPGSGAEFTMTNSIVAGNSRGTEQVTISDVFTETFDFNEGGNDGPLTPEPPLVDLTVASSFIGDLSGSGLLAGGSIRSFSSTGTTLDELLVVDVGDIPLLADNGGLTPTVALPAGSVAINTGDNDSVPATLQNDQRGDGFPRIFAITVDLGAYEFPNTRPVITLEGDATIRIEAGIVSTYTDPGATALDAEDGDLTNLIITGGVDAVDTTILGDYTITYDVIDSFGQAAEQVTRTVIVEDTIAPVITLTGDALVQLRAGLDSYNELGASVFDAGDPTVTVSIGGDTVVTSALGEYIVTYNAIDVSGNRATEVTRVVNVVNNAPTITLVGDSTIRVECNIGSYSELGATASDAEEGDTLTDNIVIGGDTVDPSTLGEYTITYDVIDSFGQAAEQVTRTVIVEDTTPPVITLIGGDLVLQAGIDSYSELGASVFDACDADVEIVIDDDQVDTFIVGEYTVTYNATDASDNSAVEVTRTVNVVAPPQFSIAPLQASVREGDIGTAAATFTITRSGAIDRGGSIDWEVLLQDDLTSADFAETSGTIDFEAGSTSEVLTVLVNGDNLVESDEVFTVALSGALPVGALIDQPNSRADGTIVNDDAAPVANDDGVYVTIEDNVLNVSAVLGVLANDTDSDDGDGSANLSVSSVAVDVTNGTLTLNADGSFIYEPDADFFGNDSFAYVVSDGDNTAEATATIRVEEQIDLSVTIDVLQDPVVAGGDAFAIFRVTVINIASSDATGVTLSQIGSLPAGVIITDSDPSTGTFDGVNWSFDLASSESATLSITLQANPSAPGGINALAYAIGVTASDQPDSNALNDQASGAASIISPLDLGLSVDAEPSALRIDRQTGLLIGEITITNNGEVVVPAYRVFVSNLPEDVQLYNASGSALFGDSETELPYLLYNQPLDPGESITLDVQYFRPSMDLDFSPVYEIEPLPFPETGLPTAESGIDFERMMILSNGDVLLEIASVPGTSYVLEYTDNLSDGFIRTRQRITAAANRLQVIDSGPPLTETAPGDSRFYRFIEISSER